MVLLTQNSGIILGPIAKVLGFILNWLFEFCSNYGLSNIGITIVLFTIVIKLLLLPLTIKQQRFSKFSNIMNPELQALQAKYKGKTDNASMMKMQEEQRAIYAKYGTSQVGGCVQMIIQMPILFALYRVLQNIPAYVTPVKNLFINFIDGANGLLAQNNFATIMAENFNPKGDYTSINGVIDVLNTFSASNWEKLVELFPQCAELITTNREALVEIYNLFTIDLSVTPTLKSISVLIPILTAFTQWLSMKTLNSKQTNVDPDNPMAQSMKSMNTIMPIMILAIGFSVPAGLGFYWIVNAVITTIQQVVINRYLDKIDIEDLKNRNKAIYEEKKAREAEKNANRPESSFQKYVKEAQKNNPKARQITEKLEAVRDENLKKAEEIRKASYEAQESKSNPKKGLAARANMVSEFNEKNKK
ncbi:MAG: membrane protein insertase YidC [Lachnospiraceae bacterium]|nr:membrane protein insertase YidC [Lachnospiraceae bacterium]